ncbi:MAG: hypothetical protein ACK56F_15555, partial [bacterium]
LTPEASGCSPTGPLPPGYRPLPPAPLQGVHSHRCSVKHPSSESAASLPRCRRVSTFLPLNTCTQPQPLSS